MTPHANDARRVTQAFQVALGRQTVTAAKQAASWFDASSLDPVAGVRLVERLLPQWREAVELGVAFYRLYAYLMTGRTVSSPLIRGAQTVTTIGQLIRDFERTSGQKLTLTVGRYAAQKVEVQQVKAPQFRSMFTEQAEWAKTQFDQHKSGDGDPTWFTGIAQQIVADGARDVVLELGERDTATVGWIRVSSTGSPCAFCALLMSRGSHYRPYRTRRSAGGILKGGRRVGGKDFHPHCKCIAVPIYKGSDPNSDPLFALNRQFQADYESDWGTNSRGENRVGSNGWRSYYNSKYGRRTKQA